MFKSAIVLGSAVFCAVLAGTGVLSLGQHTPQADFAATEAASSIDTNTTTDTHVTAIPKAKDGHFWANATVNTRAVRFLVDTGATVVALTPADAQRLGFDAKSLTYDREVTTANGKTYAATVNLSVVGIGQSTVRNVDAMVVKDGLTTSLLGMSYLGRLSRFEATPSSLILHP
ncbi:TIGR02281 family clan AA aspartic protease [Asticcacaulis taihuensis]|jgi:aspartyl protease family protein|uniref:TIGR02281 family clan AA aspartic protease n=1 Tax=Asticcacaulis taihuensis TaxID=260084 RepID=UPI0026EF5C71|nr:TIGR02281 family clan AA aspartic protease [Asticcacaulis taihuensis]